MSSLRDPALGVGYLRSELAELLDSDADLAAAAVSVVLAQVAARSGDAQGLLIVLGALLAPLEMSFARDRLAAAARETGLLDVALIVGSHSEPAVGTDETERQPDFGLGRPLALGERKSLARRRDREVLARVLRDPHPDVIRIVLRNPAVTEEDVVRLAARRPVHAEVLREIAASVRWILRYGVRLAVLKNPYAPLEVALPLLPLVVRSDRSDLARSADLAPRLRDLAALGNPTLH